MENLKDLLSKVSDKHKLVAKELLLMLDPRIEYGELSKLIKEKYNVEINPHMEMAHILGVISSLAHELNLPMLSSIVVNKETHYPGQQFYELYDLLNETDLTNASDKIKETIVKYEQNYTKSCKNWKELEKTLGIKVTKN